MLFYFDGGGRAEFFDSYGKSPEYYNEQFVTCLQRNSVVQSYNSEKLQNDSSNVCGQYCLFYLIHRLRNRSMYSILKLFENIDFNDQYVYDYISMTFPYCNEINTFSNQTCVSLNKSFKTYYFVVLSFCFSPIPIYIMFINALNIYFECHLSPERDGKRSSVKILKSIDCNCVWTIRFG